MTRRVAPRFELWRQTKLKGGWSDWFHTGTFDTLDDIVSEVERQITARNVSHSPHPSKMEIRKVTTVIVAEPHYEPKPEWRAP